MIAPAKSRVRSASTSTGVKTLTGLVHELARGVEGEDPGLSRHAARIASSSSSGPLLSGAYLQMHDVLHASLNLRTSDAIAGPVHWYDVCAVVGVRMYAGAQGDQPDWKSGT